MSCDADPRDASIQRVIALPGEPRFRFSRKCFGFESAQIAARTRGRRLDHVDGGLGLRQRSVRPARSAGSGPIEALRRIDPRSNRVTRTIALKHSYERLTASPTALWGTTCGAGWPSCRARPRRESSCTASARATAGRRPSPAWAAGRVTGLAATEDAVWISHIGRRSRGGTLLRVDRRTGRVSTVLRFEGTPSPVSIGEGGVWVIDTFARRLFRVPADPPPAGGPAAGA